MGSIEGARYIEVHPELAEVLDREAIVADLALSSAARALIAGAIKDGQASRLIGIGASTLPDRYLKRRPDPHRHAWEVIGDSGGPGKAATVGRGPFRMARKGSLSTREPKPEDGWYLTGPGIKKPMWVGLKKREAVDRANQVIVSLDHKRRNER